MRVAHHDEFWGVDILQGGRSYPLTPVYHHFQVACTCCSLESQLILTDQITCFSQSLNQAIHDAEDDLEKIKLLAEEAREKLQQVGLLGTQRITLRQILTDLIIAFKYIHVLHEEETSMERSLYTLLLNITSQASPILLPLFAFKTECKWTTKSGRSLGTRLVIANLLVTTFV